MNRIGEASHRFPWLPKVLGAFIVAGIPACGLAVAAALADWQRNRMLAIAALIGIMVALAAIYLLRARDAAELALRNVRVRVGGILDSAMDAIITVDASQRVVLFNRAAEAVFGWPRQDAIGAPLENFIPQRFRGAHAELVRRFGETGGMARRMGGQRIVMGLRRNGEEFPIDASISQVVEDGHRLFTVILRDVSERIRAEEALRTSREELREFAVAANSVREQEKRRIARELHDELGQALTALKIDVEWLREQTPGAAPVLHKLSAMRDLLDGTVAAARRISSDLRPLMLDDLGLVAACEWLAHNFEARTGIACELVLGAGELDLPDPHATALFRVLQESLTNAARHSAATQVEVTLERAGEEVVLTVSDNGRGFASEAPLPAGTHGLLGLRERAYLLGGTARVQSAAGAGTSIELRLPLQSQGSGVDAPAARQVS